MPQSKSIVKASDAVASPVDPNQTLKASKALLAYIKTASAAAQAAEVAAGKESLLGDAEDARAETPIWLTVTTKQNIHNSHRLKPGKMTLPHPLRAGGGSSNSSSSKKIGDGDDHDAQDGNGEKAEEEEEDLSTICLITADPQSAFKEMVDSDAFPADLRQRITRVVDMRHLRATCRGFEDQRRLRARHDVFLADDRIVHMLPKTLGKTFFRGGTKRPIPVVLMPQRARDADGKTIAKRDKDSLHPLYGSLKRKMAAGGEAAAASMRPVPEIAIEICKAVGAAVVNLSPSNSIAVVIGYAGWPVEHVAANVASAVRQLVARWVPKQWANVRAVFIKGPATAALPIWQTDELWLDGERDVVPDAQAAPGALPGMNKGNKSSGGDAADKDATKKKRKAERANIGKKRKVIEEAGEEGEEEEDDGEGEEAVEKEEEAEERPRKKAKKAKKTTLPASNDDRLDQEIAARKATLVERKRKEKQSKKKAAKTGEEAEEADEGLAAEEAFMAKRRAKAAKQDQTEAAEQGPREAAGKTNKKLKAETARALEQQQQRAEDKKEAADRKAKLKKQKSAAKNKDLEI